jgi:hypothetical protein
MTAPDQPLYLWALWIALRHHPRDQRGHVTSRIIEPEEVLAGWLEREPDDDALRAELEITFDAPATLQTDLPAGLRIELRDGPGLIAAWGASYESMSGAPAAVAGADLLALVRQLLTADDPPALPRPPSAPPPEPVIPGCDFCASPPPAPIPPRRPLPAPARRRIARPVPPVQLEMFSEAGP